MSYSNINNLKEIINKKILFYDLETTGLVKSLNDLLKPEEKYPDYKDIAKYENARIVSIGWLYMENFDYDYEIEIDNIHEQIIKPDGFIIPDNAIKIHGITNEEANNNGFESKKILKKIAKIIKECDYIIGYNVYFDINILLSELYRNKLYNSIKKIIKMKEEEKIICIAQISAKEIKLDGFIQNFNYRIPRLVHVYKKCFNEELNNAHNAKSDVLGMIKIIYWIYENMKKKEKKRKNIISHKMSS